MSDQSGLREASASKKVIVLSTIYVFIATTIV